MAALLWKFSISNMYCFSQDRQALFPGDADDL